MKLCADCSDYLLTIKFETGCNSPPVLKIDHLVMCLATMAYVYATCTLYMLLLLVWFNNFAQTTSFYWNYMLLL